MIFSGTYVSGVSGESGLRPGTETLVIRDSELREGSNLRGAGEDLRCAVRVACDMFVSV